MNHAKLTRRHVLTGAAGTAAVAVAGCLGGEDGDDEQFDGPPEQREAYVVAYHWGYAAFDGDGQELDLIEIPPNTELTIHAVNDHAYDAFDELPEAVAAELEDFDGLTRLKAKVEAGEFPEPSGDQTVEEVYEAAHGHGDGHEHDSDGHGHNEDGHGHDEDDGHGHDDGHHGDDDHGDDNHGHGEDDGHHEDDGHGHEGGMLDHGFRLHGIDFEVPADTDEPETGSTVFEEPGTYQAYCTVPCGEYHSHQRQDLVRVGEE